MVFRGRKVTQGSIPLLSVRYGNDVPAALAELLEHHARRAGLSLAALEVIGASLDFVEAFIVAAEDGEGAAFARRLGLLPPEDMVSKARWQAEKIFGRAG
jgi:hypothetical protein